MSEFDGKTIILTGASEGIGRAMALELASRGAQLFVTARNSKRLESLQAECRAIGADCEFLSADLTDQAQCGALIETCGERFGGIDIFVNNAGATMWEEFSEVSDLAIFRRVMDINYYAAVYCTHYSLPWLRERGGLLVAIASLAGLTGVPSRSGYAASKHAMIGFFDSLRIELRDSGVDVTVIAPDFVVSEIHKRALKGDGRAMGDTPMQESKIMSAEQCAKLCVGAIAGRKRLLLTSWRGRLGRWLKLLSPDLIDRIALRAISERR
jgi:short-subunit dehydrogenase